MGLFGSAKSKFQSDLTEEYFFGVVANEMANNVMSPGLYAKAFAEAEGDESKAKAKYIGLRVAMLKSEDAALREQQQEMALAEQLKLKAAQKEAEQEEGMEAQRRWMRRER